MIHRTPYIHIDKIISQAESTTGTWSLAFFEEMERVTSKINLQDSEYLIQNLFKFMENDKCTSLARFKLAQLLSFFRSSGNSNLKLTLSKSSHDIEKILEKVEDDKYSKPIKCLLSQHLNNASTNERHNARLGSMSGSISRFAVLPENRRFRFSASTIDKCSSLPLFTSVGQK